MGIYKVLDDKVYDICHRHSFNVQTKVEKDGSYHAVFLADSRNETVKEAITMLETLGLRKVQIGCNLCDFIHHYSINFNSISFPKNMNITEEKTWKQKS